MKLIVGLFDFAGLFAKVTKPIELGSMFSITQPTQVSWVLESNLLSLYGLTKTNARPGFSCVCCVCCQSDIFQRAGLTEFQFLSKELRWSYQLKKIFEQILWKGEIC